MTIDSRESPDPSGIGNGAACTTILVQRVSGSKTGAGTVGASPNSPRVAVQRVSCCAARCSAVNGARTCKTSWPAREYSTPPTHGMCRAALSALQSAAGCGQGMSASGLAPGKQTVTRAPVPRGSADLTGARAREVAGVAAGAGTRGGCGTWPGTGTVVGVRLSRRSRPTAGAEAATSANVLVGLSWAREAAAGTEA